MLTLDTKIESLHKVGPVYLKKLHKLGIKTIRDLFFHFPHRYEDFSQITPVSQIKQGQKATVAGKITEIKNIRTFKRKMYLTSALVNDETGTIRAMWFNRPYLASTLKKGTKVHLAGKLTHIGKNLCLSNPVYEIIRGEKDGPKETTHTGRLVPVYHETAGLTSRYLRFLIKPLLYLTKNTKEFLPEAVRTKYQLAELGWALKQVHFPIKTAYLQKAKERLAFNELYLLQLQALNQKRKLEEKKAVPIEFEQKLIKPFVKNLPFKLTDDQKIAVWEILQDIAKEKPMNRLLNGDVGSGKTIVAATCALQTAKAGYQTALMAPTEILAKQHFETFCNFLKKQKLKIALLTSTAGKINKRKTEKNKLKEKIKKGGVNIIIGTHALIQKDVSFKNLALAVIDEQHRFGVNQRAALLKAVSLIKDGLPTVPHFLSMTATPIPRTLALTIYGNLDISTIHQMPQGRQKTISKIIIPKEQASAYEFIKKQLKKGKQAFIICPLITESDKLTIKQEEIAREEVKSVEKELANLSKKVFSDFKLAGIHGRMKPKEKDKIMENFRRKKTDVLIATSLLEVGIDIPNATVMVVEDADRFGLAQLHQFRGRIGRNKDQSYCLLFTSLDNPVYNRRLRALVRSQDGFKLAQEDLKIRGPGDFIGFRQWGLPDLVMASFNDLELIKKARQAARQTLENNLINPALQEKLKGFEKNIHLE